MSPWGLAAVAWGSCLGWALSILATGRVLTPRKTPGQRLAESPSKPRSQAAPTIHTPLGAVFREQEAS